MHNEIMVIIPTYNEKNNILQMIKSIDGLELPIDILIVDDNSPDGTGELVESIKQTKSNLDVMHRDRKEGLGPAYLAAFRYVLNKKKYKYIIQMDADFSHNPKDIPRLLDATRHHDVVVGSRYVKGGGISRRWNILRKLISRGGNIYARLVGGLDTNDCTGGFRCYKKEALKSIDLNKRFLKGYGFQVQLLYELKKNGFKSCEVPIFFDERREGSSKMSLNIFVEAFLSLTSMRLKDIFTKK